jgi:hypothetical protein
VAVRERTSRPGFQVLLELHRAFLVAELDDDINTPGPTIRRVPANTGTMGCKSG